MLITCRISPLTAAVLVFITLASLYSLNVVFNAPRYDVSGEELVYVEGKLAAAQDARDASTSDAAEPEPAPATPAAAPAPRPPVALASTSQSLPVSHPKYPSVVACQPHDILDTQSGTSDLQALQDRVLARMGLGDAKPLAPEQEGVCFFHSQHPHNQDQKIFTRLGGKVMGCKPYKGMKNVNHVSATKRCQCVAPPASAFNLGFLEIGAADGQMLSNSLFFESQLGWRGVCVEGSPRTFLDLQKNRPLCYNVNALVGVRDSLGEAMTFYSFDSADPKKPGWRIAMSCMEGNGVCSSAETAYKYAADNHLCLRVDAVQIKPLSEIFDEAGLSGDMGWFSFDVEGAEDFVIPTVDFTKTQPHYVSIEGKRDGHPKAAEHLLNHGYKADGKLGIDELYVLPR